MSVQTLDYERFSSVVRLELHADGRAFSLASIGPDSIIARDPVDLEACDAQVVAEIDGERFSWPVRLEHGAVPFESLIATTSLGKMQRIL